MTAEIVHIGFSKTATMTLQTHLFVKHPDIANVARPFENSQTSELCTALALADDMDFAQWALASHIAESRAKLPRLLVYSDETVVNSPIRSVATNRLKQLFPNGWILAVLRSQLEACASHYENSGCRLRQVPEPFAGRHVDFENYLEYHLAKTSHGFVPTLMYNETLEVIERLFGADRVHVLPFEGFIADRPAFVAMLSKILEIDTAEIDELVTGQHEHERTSEAVGQYQALRSRFLWNVPISNFLPGSRYIKQALFRLWGNKPLDVTYSAPWRERIESIYQPGNRALRDRYHLPLDRYGYPL